MGRSLRVVELTFFFNIDTGQMLYRFTRSDVSSTIRDGRGHFSPSWEG